VILQYLCAARRRPPCVYVSPRPLAMFFCAMLAACVSGCFGTVNDPVRHYYTLHLEPLHRVPTRHVPGLVRVRDLDAEAAYDRFQMVIRRSPFELSYRQKEVWAVKPQRMISDLIARGLMDQGLFSGVTRELGERRPNYLLSGELHAIEVYDSQDTWFAHLAMSWQITDFEAGKTLWTYNYDDRKQVTPGDFSHAVRAISELLTRAIELGLTAMQNTHFPDSVALDTGSTPDRPVVPEGGQGRLRGAPSSMPPPDEALPAAGASPGVSPPPHNDIDMPPEHVGRAAPELPIEVPQHEHEASPLRPRDLDQPPPGVDGELEEP
jgi:ABC-type uncharacterized transport system auxiliary subunit